VGWGVDGVDGFYDKATVRMKITATLVVKTKDMEILRVGYQLTGGWNLKSYDS